MDIASKIGNNKLKIKLTSIIIGVILLFVFSSSFRNFNTTISEYIYKIIPSSEIDSNIVLIEITSEDIQKLGMWPLKRSYYALLIDELESYNVRKIGIEVFLSDKIPLQSVYNKLLNEKIYENQNIVLGSLLSGVNGNLNDAGSIDTILYPQPKIENNNTETGHLNFIYENGIVIPISVKYKNIVEESFSEKLSGVELNDLNGRIKINSNKSLQSLTKYSLLEFFRLAQENTYPLTNLKNKIVIVGVSDPSTAKMYSVTNLGLVPGVYIHTIAVDNILNSDFINESYLFISALLFLLLIIASLFLKEKFKSNYIYIILFAFFISVSILSSFLNLELDFSAFLFPFIFLVIAEILLFNAEKISELSQSVNETEVLRIALANKEKQLENLENQKTVLPDQSNNLEIEIERLKDEVSRLRESETDTQNFDAEETESETKVFFNLVYRSKQMTEVVETVKKVAPQNVTILITGESGSGKELVANAIHNLSDRTDANFIAVNCAALSDTLLESELFGHVKGAFTNAVADKKGMFEAADKGTIFLDEIGETTENFQVKLLRVLQSGEYMKVGSSQARFTDVRVIAATNKNFEKLVAEKKFREDLYYRLKVIAIHIPALRERKDDIEILVLHFVQREDEKLSISQAVINQLINNNWTGNVRELESVVKRAAIFAKSENRDLIQLCDLPEEIVKFDKSDLESLIIDSLRSKKFSHSSINETAVELGGLNRTVIAEHFRGFFFKQFVLSDFNFDLTIKKIAQSEEHEVIKKVSSKAEVYIKNLEKDLGKISKQDFESVKIKFSSKYKNLPNKYHNFFDKVIEFLLTKDREN